MSLVRALGRRYAFAFRKAMRGIARRFGDPLPALHSKVEVSSDAISTARIIRGESHRPVIMIHGVFQRSGTAYTGELLKLHPDVCAYPRGLLELPFLNLAESIRRLQGQFFFPYPPNRTKMGSDDFLPLFGASFISYIHLAVPAGKSALFRMPDVSSLAYFPYLFPFEIPLLLLRDGRDVVESTVRSWPEMPFPEACLRWNRNARIMLEQQKLHAREGWQIFRYEDAVRNTPQFIEQVCKYCHLDAGRYPFDRISEIPVVGSSALKREGRVTWDPLARPAGFNPIGRWQTWTRRQARIFKRICGRTLIESGYADNLDW